MINLEQWLERHGLDKYKEIFVENDVDFDVLAQLTEEHLKELGVSLGDRLRFVKALGTLEDTGAGATPPPSAPRQQADTPVSTGEAERRQLTVMFCDLVGSTALSSKLDPEDMREVISSFQAACRNAIELYGGFIARYMGDGMLNYFGYPQAHENDAERAVRAGLAIVDAMTELNAGIGKRHDIALAVRVGVATGPVVVGDIVGDGAAEEAAVVGETPNLAARLQGIASPDQVVVAAATHGLLESSFEYEDLGSHALKGIDAPVQAWRAVRERDVHSRYEADHGRGRSTPLVGRQEELGLLLRSWETTKQGHGQAILVQGEAGIGKSRLIEALREHVAADDYVWVAHRCSPYHANSTLYPIIEHLKRALGWSAESSAEEKLDMLEAALAGQSLPLPEIIPLYAELLSLTLPEGRYMPSELEPRQKREATLDAVAAWLLEMAEKTPVLNVWEDLHWADPSTLELLELYLEQSPTVSMMNVLTYRPEFVPTWSMRSHMVPVTLNRLERPEVEALVGYRASGKHIPEEVVEHIVTKSDGVPLYVEELTKTILESEFLHEEADRFVLSGELSELSIPATLQDSLMARLDRLPTLREVAQMGAVLGREFAYEMLRAVVGVEEPQLQDGLEQLVADELLYQRGRVPRSKYIFKHALIQDAAYQSLLKRTRQECHKRVALLLEEQFHDTVESHPELVAHHYTEGAEPERAIAYWQKAGERARALSANLEAIAYFTRGIEALDQLPDNEERARQELSLQLSLGHANIVAKGHGSVDAEKAYTRALALSETLGDASDLVPALFGLWRSFVVGRTLDETNNVALQLRRIADQKQQTELEVVANYTSGATALWMGQPGDARAWLEKSIALYRPSRDSSNIYRAAQDPGVACRGYLANAEWLLGYPDRARELMRESIALAEEFDDRFSLAFALCFAGATVSELCTADTETLLERGLNIATENGYNLWILYGNIQRANLQFEKPPSDSAFEAFRGSIDALLDIGVFLNTPYFLTLLARAYQRAGHIAQALQVLDEAQQSIEARGERWSEAEIHRVRGEVLLSRSQDDADDAETCFRQALDVARGQEARSLELRAATSLARLRQRQGHSDEARRELGDCYAWFSEGFDTADLREAKQLLDSIN
jgi:class 3 adenylate cyclase/predicted ATPase